MQYKWVALTVTSVGTLMAGIDGRIVIVGLPTIAKELGAPIDEVIWVTQAYLLASTVGLLLIGRITDVIGRVKIYNIGFAVFTIGSALASVALSPIELILSRIVQGVGSAMLIANSAAILTDATPTKELGTVLGINQIALRAGAVLGLTLSGIIITFADWRALFYINIPIGVFGTLWAHWRLKEVSTKDPAKKMDWPGFATFTSGLTLLLVSITLLSYGFISSLVSSVATVASGILLLAIFIRIEYRSEAPMLDLSLFNIREFAAGNLAQFFIALSWSGFIIMLSFYMQIVLGYQPIQTGVSILPLDLCFLITGPLSGKLSDRYGPRRFTTLGLALSGLALFLGTTLTVNSNYLSIALILALEGIGYGLFVSPNTSSIMGSVPSNRRGIASAFNNTLNNVGLTASSGLAVLFFTLGIPYKTLTALIQNFNPQDTLLSVKQQFVTGFNYASLIFASMIIVAIIAAAFGGGRRNKAKVPSRNDAEKSLGESAAL